MVWVGIEAEANGPCGERSKPTSVEWMWTGGMSRGVVGPRESHVLWFEAWYGAWCGVGSGAEAARQQAQCVCLVPMTVNGW